MSYTDEQIATAFERYFARTDRVMEVLRLASLNANGIYTVVNVSTDFMMVNTITQQSVGGVALMGTIEDKVNICRELVLSQNQNMPNDEYLLEQFAGIPLNVETNPFFFAAYGQEVFDYVVSKSKKEEELSKALLMRTEKGVPFYLALEKDINDKFPVRLRWADVTTMIYRKEQE